MPQTSRKLRSLRQPRKKKVSKREISPTKAKAGDSARASSLFLRRGVWRFFRYFGEILARVDSAPVRLSSAERYRCDRIGNVSHRSRYASFSAGLNRARIFAPTKTRFFSGKFKAILSSLARSEKLTRDSRSLATAPNFIYDFCCRTCNTRRSRFPMIRRC